MKLVRWVLKMPRHLAKLVVVGSSIVLSELITMTLMSALDGAPRVVITSAIVALTVPILVAWPVGSVVIQLLHDLEAARSEAQRLASTDMLTGTLNRRHFIELAERELARSRHGDGQLSVMLLDVDDFKQVNDRCGHQAGDEVLRAVAQAFQGALRPNDPLARWGGEEFVALLPSTGSAEAIGIALRVRDAIAARRVDRGDASLSPIQVTASIGVATDSIGKSESLDQLISRADTAMYVAKRSGKNAAMAATSHRGVVEAAPA